MITRFLRNAFSVDDIIQGISQYEKIGYRLIIKFEKPEPRAMVAHMSNGESLIELWQFIDKEHPLVEVIKSHIALESDDLDKDLIDLQDYGFEIVIPKTKGVVLTYAFIKDSSGNYIEIACKDSHNNSSI